MFDIEARRAERDLAGDVHIVTVTRRLQETCARAYQGKAGEFKTFGILILVIPSARSNKLRRRCIEDLEITRIENNPGRIAIAPFDPHSAGVGESGHGKHASARRHAQRAVEADHFAVEVTVVDAVKHERGEFARFAQPLGEWHGGAEQILSLLRQGARSIGVPNMPGAMRQHANAELSEFARRRQSQRSDTALDEE